MPELDIDALLDEEPAAEVQKKDEAAAQPQPEKKALTEEEASKILAENARMKKAMRGLNDKVKQLTQPKEETPEPQPDPEDPLNTREGWKQLIDVTAEAKAKALIQPIYEANFKRARDRFLQSHPEYATTEGKDQLRQILEAAKATGKVDESDIFEELGKAWASIHWKDLEAQNQKTADARRRAQAAAMSAANPPASEPSNQDDFTEDELAEAAAYGKDPAKYRKAKKLLDEVTRSA